ncbi:MAG: PD-(D/E)XK nuclease domain-containing protein, partial [Kiritimatiellae bacterium]|nr:PD-(D/E)XK nuclease domain-containing protein [Kiritimatiellia bacterium]
LANGMDFVLEKSLVACFARIPHEWKLASEAEAKRFFQLYCHFLGAKIKGEHESHLGRADAVLELPNGVYLFEFKYAKSSAEALAQIKSRGYADAYQDDSRPVWLVGCNYNPETRSLDKPAMERLG